MTSVSTPSQSSELVDRLRRREAIADDEAFRFELFCRSRPGGEDFAHFDPELRGMLLRQQFQAQTASYRASHPQSRYEILEIDGAPVGGMIADRSCGAIHILELAFLPEWRGAGLGSFILKLACAEGQETSMPVRFEVYVWEEHLLRLYERLGFRPYGRTEMQFLMEWRPTLPGES